LGQSNSLRWFRNDIQNSSAISAVYITNRAILPVVWRTPDPAFDRSCTWSREQGYDLLAHLVVEEVMQSIRMRNPAMARLIFNLRRQQLARQASAYFSNGGLGR